MKPILNKLTRMAKGQSLASDAAWALLGNLKTYLKDPQPILEKFILRDAKRLKEAIQAEQKGH